MLGGPALLWPISFSHSPKSLLLRLLLRARGTLLLIFSSWEALPTCSNTPCPVCAEETGPGPLPSTWQPSTVRLLDAALYSPRVRTSSSTHGGAPCVASRLLLASVRSRRIVLRRRRSATVPSNPLETQPQPPPRGTREDPPILPLPAARREPLRHAD
jgi:hypothetical protein